MGIQVEHELHRRRLGRNVGLALVLLVFVGLVFGLTLVKTKRGDFAMRPNATGELDPNYHPQPAQPQSGSGD